MAKTVKFKTPGTKIQFTNGQVISDANITYEKYEELVALNPSYAGKFVVTDTKVKETEPAKEKADVATPKNKS
jgi:hypothetical protein